MLQAQLLPAVKLAISWHWRLGLVTDNSMAVSLVLKNGNVDVGLSASHFHRPFWPSRIQRIQPVGRP